MKNVKVLDCTLRDGGRVIDCAFGDRAIRQIADKLARAGIDIVELGFLRDPRLVSYEAGSTFFTDVGQIARFVPADRRGSEYVAFADYGMFDFGALAPRSGDSIDGIRVGFTKDDYGSSREELLRAFRAVKERGYSLYAQGVNSLSYSDIELLSLVGDMNAAKPCGFGIVDTYGAMYSDDVARIYGLIDHNLDSSIAIDFHSHNNFQLSFSFAQEVIRLSNGVRGIVIDATLGGMGKVAGNLCTELIADFLARKMGYGYDTDLIFDAIDEHLYDLREKHHWGYSPMSLLSGIYRSHPNNVIYLANKFRLDTKDVKNILATLGERERQRYDYGRIDRLAEEYSGCKYDDSDEMAGLAEAFAGKPILVLAPGRTLATHRGAITGFIAGRRPIIVSVNFVSGHPGSYSFFANKKRYGAQCGESDESGGGALASGAGGGRAIVTSNIERRAPGSITVNYHSLVSRGYRLFDNSVLMLLNLLGRLRVAEIAIAGMDGFRGDEGGDYFDGSFDVARLEPEFGKINAEIAGMLEKYLAAAKGSCKVELITPSVFGSVFGESRGESGKNG
jgi:4-hydroxy 2-oxovalerate aldolase